MHIHIFISIQNRKTIFKEIQNFVHLNLAIALSLALVVFVSGIQTATENDVSLQFTKNHFEYVYLNSRLLVP